MIKFKMRLLLNRCSCIVSCGQKFEDQELLDLKPLPAPKLVPTPDGLPNELFGDIAMVTEFVSCYSGLLMPKDDFPIYTGRYFVYILN